MYARLLDVLLSKCELPEGFVSWDEYDADEADEDSLTELREGAQVGGGCIDAGTVPGGLFLLFFREGKGF